MRDPVLAAIGDDLRRAVRRRVARRRRRRLALAVTLCAAALAAVTGALAGGVDPLALLPKIRGMAPPAHDVRRVDLTVAGRAGRWHVVTYRSRQGSLCTTGVLGAARPTEVGCGAGLAILPRRGVASLAFFRPHMGRRLVAGTVLADVDRVVLEDVDGTHVAALSATTLVVPVEVPREGLTALGRREAARAPRRLVLRLFAVELAQRRHAGHWTRRQVLAAPRLRIQVRRGDGRVTVAGGPPASG